MCKPVAGSFDEYSCDSEPSPSTGVLQKAYILAAIQTTLQVQFSIFSSVLNCNQYTVNWASLHPTLLQDAGSVRDDVALVTCPTDTGLQEKGGLEKQLKCKTPVFRGPSS